MREWDIFISHASEDKAEVVIPLAEALRRAGLRVWLDRQELRLGDSLRTKIDEGLANSRFGVVILSPSFFAKHWPQAELDGLFAREEALRGTVILPVWHGMDKRALVSHSPILAERVAANTKHGMAYVTSKILETVTRRDAKLPLDLHPTPLRLLVRLLDAGPGHRAIVDFFESHRVILEAALPGASEFARSVDLDDVVVDLAIKAIRHTTKVCEWTLLQFASHDGTLVNPDDTLVLDSVLSRIEHARRWIARNPQAARALLPGLTPGLCHCVVVAGRRQSLSPDAISSLKQLNHELVGVTVRTYDWLIDAAAKADVHDR